MLPCGTQTFHNGKNQLRGCVYVSYYRLGNQVWIVPTYKGHPHVDTTHTIYCILPFSSPSSSFHDCGTLSALSLSLSAYTSTGLMIKTIIASDTKLLQRNKRVRMTSLRAFLRKSGTTGLSFHLKSTKRIIVKKDNTILTV